MFTSSFYSFLSPPPTNQLFKSPALISNISPRRVSPLTLCPWVLVQVLRVSPCAEVRSSSLPSTLLPSTPASVFLLTVPIHMLPLPDEIASVGYTLLTGWDTHFRFLPPFFLSQMLTGWAQALGTPGWAHWLGGRRHSACRACWMPAPSLSQPGLPPGSLLVPGSFHNSVSLYLLYLSPVCPSFSLFLGFPGGSAEKSPPANAGDTGVSGSISGLGRSPGVGNGNPLQYSCLENSMDRGAWRATALGVTNNQSQLSKHALFLLIDFYFLEICTLWSFPPSTGRYMCLKTFCLPLM